jgi:hypothetical protein
MRSHHHPDDHRRGRQPYWGDDARRPYDTRGTDFDDPRGHDYAGSTLNSYSRDDDEPRPYPRDRGDQGRIYDHGRTDTRGGYQGRDHDQARGAQRNDTWDRYRNEQAHRRDDGYRADYRYRTDRRDDYGYPGRGDYRSDHDYQGRNEYRGAQGRNDHGRGDRNDYGYPARTDDGYGQSGRDYGYQRQNDYGYSGRDYPHRDYQSHSDFHGRTDEWRGRSDRDYRGPDDHDPRITDDRNLNRNRGRY